MISNVQNNESMINKNNVFDMIYASFSSSTLNGLIANELIANTYLGKTLYIIQSNGKFKIKGKLICCSVNGQISMDNVQYDQYPEPTSFNGDATIDYQTIDDFLQIGINIGDKTIDDILLVNQEQENQHKSIKHEIFDLVKLKMIENILYHLPKHLSMFHPFDIKHRKKYLKSTTKASIKQEIGQNILNIKIPNNINSDPSFYTALKTIIWNNIKCGPCPNINDIFSLLHHYHQLWSQHIIQNSSKYNTINNVDEKNNKLQPQFDQNYIDWDETELRYTIIKQNNFKHQTVYSQETHSNHLLIQHLPRTMSEGTLAILFSYYGTLQRCQLIIDPETLRSRCYGFVKYDNITSAECALQQVNGYEINGKILRVSFIPLDESSVIKSDNIYIASFWPHYFSGPYLKLKKNNGDWRCMKCFKMSPPKVFSTMINDNIIFFKSRRTDVTIEICWKCVEKMGKTQNQTNITTKKSKPKKSISNIVSVPQNPMLDKNKRNANNDCDSVEDNTEDIGMQKSSNYSLSFEFNNQDSCLDEDDDNTNLLINNLPETLSEGTMATIFSPYGILERCKIVIDLNTLRSQGFGFIKYENHESAKRALKEINGYEIDDKKIKVSFARPQCRAIMNANLKISNLPTDYNHNELRKLFQLFQNYGKIIENRVILDQYRQCIGIGFVRMDKHHNAINALQAMNEYVFDEKYSPLLVQLAQKTTH